MTYGPYPGHHPSPLQHVAVLVAIGVDNDGFREVLGVCQAIRVNDFEALVSLV